MIMLSRTANRLFWIGRYVERIEHLSRYINAQYLSSSDAPQSFDKQWVLDSMLDMTQSAGSFQQQGGARSDEQVITYLTVDPQNPYCITNYVGLVRENARGVRDNISVELWEMINRFYHSAQEFEPDDLNRKGPYDFCKSMLDNTNMVKGVMDNTLLRNQVWSMLYMGMHLERSLQIVQMLLTKRKDIARSKDSKLRPAILNYHLAALLRSAGGLDMSRHHYGTPPNERLATDFLVLNVKFPKSVRYNLDKLEENLRVISNYRPVAPDTVEFSVGKMAAHLRFLTAEGIMEQSDAFFEKLQHDLINIGGALEEQYFSF